jgi:replicative DNA helicase
MQTHTKTDITRSRSISDRLLAKYSIEPPNNVESESDFLKGLIEHKDIIESLKLSNNVRDIFYTETGSKVYDLIVSLYDRGALTINVLIIELQKIGLRKKVMELYPELLLDRKFINLEVLKETFRALSDLTNQRLALNAILGSIDDLDNGNVEGVVERAENVVEALKNNNLDIIDYGIANHMNKAIERINIMTENPIGLFPKSGLNSLNGLIPYWYDSDIILIGGRPGSGKTICGLKHSIEAAVQGFAVGYISLEMPATSLIMRMISTYSFIPYKRIKEGIIHEHEKERFNQSVESVKALPIFFYDSFQRDIKDITRWMRIMAKEKGVKMFVIDYIQLITDSTVSTDEYSQITAVSKKVKQIQMELAVPIIELAQLNREVEGTTSKRPSTKNLRGSGQLEQDASVIIMLHRSDFYGFEEAKKTNAFYEAENTIEYIIQKNRDGGIDSVLLHCEPAFNLIKDL